MTQPTQLPKVFDLEAAVAIARGVVRATIALCNKELPHPAYFDGVTSEAPIPHNDGRAIIVRVNVQRSGYQKLGVTVTCEGNPRIVGADDVRNILAGLSEEGQSFNLMSRRCTFLIDRT